MTGPEPKPLVVPIAGPLDAKAGPLDAKRERETERGTAERSTAERGTGQGVKLREVVAVERVRERIAEIADAMARDYQDRPLVLLVIAEGARRFGDALIDALEERLVFPDLVFVRARRTEGTTLGAVQVDAIDLRTFAGRDVVIVDDIADEGVTLEAIAGLVDEAEPNSLELAVLVSKLGRRRIELRLRYVGFEIERGWVVGYGMDLEGHYRDLDSISIVEGQD
jgi:hypoxanthine phosphoribosyltransferase